MLISNYSLKCIYKEKRNRGVTGTEENILSMLRGFLYLISFFPIHQQVNLYIAIVTGKSLSKKV
jgi:hypothetical protein